MAPTKKTTDVTIDQITKDDFLNNCCPMRTGSRCRNKSACALKIERINQSTLQNAENFRDQILQQIASLKHMRPTATDPAWDTIQGQVAEVLESALCKNHMAQLDTAMDQTMSFLKQTCGISRKAQSGSSHAAKALSNHPYVPETNLCAPTTTYTPATNHLASLPMSPPNFGFQRMQQPFFDYHINDPIKAESVDFFYSAQSEQASTHSDLHFPTNSGQVVATHFVTPSATEVTRVQPSHGSGVRPREHETLSRSIRPHTTLNLGGRGHTEQQRTVLHPTQHQTPEHESVLATQYRDLKLSNEKLSVDNKALSADNEKLKIDNEKLASKLAADNEMKEQLLTELENLAEDKGKLEDDNAQLLKGKKKLRTKCRKADDRVAELEEQNDRLKLQADNAVVRNGELDVEKEGFQSGIRDFEATVKELEDENDGLRSGLTASEKKVEELEQELAALRKLFRIVS
jgi:hypothetical protein